MKVLEDVGPSKLTNEEQELVRDAADSLFFCEDLEADDHAQKVLVDVRELTTRLVESDRWLDSSAERLLDDIEGCGPLTPVG
jgi:hypothetical protein